MNQTRTQLTVSMLVAGLLLICRPAHAEITAGGGIGFSQLSSYEDVDDGTAWRGFFGYRAASIPFYAEFQYLDSGELGIDDFFGVELQFDGFTAAAAYRMVVDSINGSDIIFKAGAYSLDVEATGAGGSATDDGSGALIGIGGNWMFTPHLGLNLDAQILFGVEDLANEEDLTVVTIGLIYAFFE
tara:strand:- start:630 stop:1184 length:555 start_codon:yes stop_codon:yes gene_type:complete